MNEFFWPFITQPLTSNGASNGTALVADTSGFYINQAATIRSNTQPDLPVIIIRIDLPGTIHVVLASLPINKPNLSSYLVADGASITAYEQEIKIRQNIETIANFRHERFPINADRHILVDQYGRKIDTVVDSSGKVRLAVDGQFTAEVDVQVDVDSDGAYDVATNPDPDSIGLIGHTRSNPTNQTHQVQRQTAKRGTADTDTVSADVSLHDHGGNQFSEDNPLHVRESGPTRDIFVFGANPEHVTNIRQVIWDFSTNYTLLATAENLSVVSDDSNDTVLGTGARTIRISGLDSSYNEIEEVVSLNGTIPVMTVAQFLRRNRIIVESVGSSGANTGNITISGSSVQGFIRSSINRDRSTIYTIPAGYTGRLKQIFASVGPSQNAAGVKYGDLDILVQEFGKPMRITNVSYIMSNGSQYVPISFGGTREFSEKTDILLSFTTEKEGSATAGYLEIFLEPI